MNNTLHYNYQNLFHFMDLGVVYQDKTGRIIEANQAAERILGYSLDEMNKMSSESNEWQAIYPDGTAFPAHEHPAIIALRTGKPVNDVVMGIMHSKGNARVWIKISAFPEFNASEQIPFRVFATFSDITNQEVMRDAMIEKEVKFKALFDNGPIGVSYHKLVYNSKGVADNFIFLDVNDVFIELVGIDPRGKLVTDAIPGIENDPGDWIGKLIHCGLSGKTIRFEQHLQALNRWYNVVAYQSSENHFVTAFFDVTNERQLQKEIREKAFLVESSANAVAMADLDKNITYVNASFLRIWGYENAEQILGRSIIDFWILDNEMDSIVETILREKRIIQEAKAIKADGSVFDVRTSASAVFDDKGKPIGLMAASEDISKFREIERSNLDNQQQLRLLFERSNDAIFLVDTITGYYIDVNSAGEKLTGRAKAELLKLKTKDISPVSANYRLKTIAEITEATNFGEVAYHQPDGTIRYALLSVIPLSGNRVYGIAHEITERKKDEADILAYNKELFTTSEALRESNFELEKSIENAEKERARVTSIIENTTDSIWAIDNNYCIIYLNHVFKLEFKQSFGVSLDVGMNLIDSLPESLRELWRQRYDRALNNEHFIFEDKVPLPDNEFVYIQVGMNPIVIDGKVIGASFFGSNITRRKRIEAEIIKANINLQKSSSALKKSNEELEIALVQAKRSKALEEANEKLKQNEAALQASHSKTKELNLELFAANERLNVQKNELEKALNNLKHTQSQLIQAEKMASMGTLTAGVAHELNNPLNFINGSAEILENYLNDKLADHKVFLDQFIDNIYVGVDRASAIIKSLNHFSRKSNETTELCDINLIIDNCLTMLNNQIKYKAVVVKDYAETSNYIKGNEGKLHQLFVNLLSNAIDAIEHEGVIVIALRIIDHALKVTIKDNGMGISRVDMDKIMDPFFTTKPPGKGTGLGLSIVYTIVNEHGATINYESECGKGTEVTLVFPRVD